MTERNIPLSAWLAFWRGLQRYHRYRVEGIEKLSSQRAMLLVAYHGRPIAHDQCMLSVALHDRLGYMVHGVTHGAVRTNRLMSWVTDGLGFVTEDGPDVEAAVKRGEHIAVQPGGVREGCRSFRHRYQLAWGERTGFIRLALRHRLPIVPLAASGVDDCYIGLNDGYVWGKRLGVPAGLPAWLGLGLGGVWPLALPLPVQITTYVGDPIELEDRGAIDPSDRQAMVDAQHRVAAALRGLLSQAARA